MHQSQSENNNSHPLDRRAFCVGAVSLAALGTTACGGGGGGGGGGVAGGFGALGSGAPQADASAPAAAPPAATDASAAPDAAPPAPQARKFVHPGLLHTEAAIERMRQKVAANAQPWVAGWNALTSNGRSQLGAKPRPLATVPFSLFGTM